MRTIEEARPLSWWVMFFSTIRLLSMAAAGILTGLSKPEWATLMFAVAILATLDRNAEMKLWMSRHDRH